MRIGIISTMVGWPWGGSEELWAMMAQRALEGGHQVSACLALRPRPDHFRFKALEEAGVQMFCRPDSYSSVRARQLSRVVGMFHHCSGESLREWLSPLRGFFATNPDVLLISEGAAIPDLEILQALDKHWAAKPYLIVSQANVEVLPRDEEHQRRCIRFYDKAAAACFVAEDNWRTTERQLAHKLVNGRVIRNPINIATVDPLPWPQEKEPAFASVARFDVHSKGQDILLEVLAAPRWRERDWRLSIYGSGQDGAYIRDLVKFYELENRVTLCGQTRDIRKVWTEHHALVLPSRLEGTPLVMVEAMLCGRPVIGTEVAGIPEWVREGHSGFLAEVATPKLFGQALERAWQQREHWQAMGNRGREDALRLYDPSPADSLLALLIEAAHAR
jgi:glycosyltransferase involved in cell wall biosynthesis